MQRIKAAIKKEEHVDMGDVKYMPNLSHCRCLGVDGFMSLLYTSGKSRFLPKVYFHPNVREDGWEELKVLHEEERKRYEEEKRTYELKEEVMSQKKKKGKGKKETAQEKKQRVYQKRKYSLGFHTLPDEPAFWDKDTVGTQVFLWPPKVFLPWVQVVRSGAVLKLDSALPPDFVPKHPSDPLPSPCPGVSFTSLLGRRRTLNAVAGSSSGPRYNDGLAPLSHRTPSPSPPADQAMHSPDHPSGSQEQIQADLVPTQPTGLSLVEDDYGDGGIPDEYLANLML
jgi:hypothetical protein